MNIVFYSISILTLMVLFCLLKKTEKKIDIIPMIIITFLCSISYQFLISYIFSILNISIDLTNLSIINIVFFIFLGIGIKKRGIQRFIITYKDVFVTLILLIIVFIIAYKDVGNLENIRYYSTDASIHYIAAREFYENNQLLNKTQNTETYKEMMPMAYVNVGILFKVFAKLIGEINLYKIFLLFDIIIFSFTGILFYFIIKDKIKYKWHYLLAGSITVIYMIGYPLNSLLSGFYYLGIGCLIINAILYIMSLQEKKIKITNAILFLLNTGIILSYSLFAPVIYLSIFIYNGYKTYKEYGKLLNKQWILNTITTLILPGIIGIVFLILPNIEAVKGISLDGYIYKNLWTNMLFFIPFAFYFLFKQIKYKKLDYMLVYFCVLISYMLILYIGTKVKIVSEYYFYKNAYILFTILLIYFFYGIKTFIKENKKQEIIAITYFIVYICLLSFSIYSNKYLLSIFDIYYNNHLLINNKENLTQDDIKMLNYIDKNNILSKTENNTLFIADFMQEAWIRAMFTYRNRFPLEKANHYEYIEKWNRGEIQYLVCFENSNIYKMTKNTINLSQKKLIFQTEKVKIYEK